jgi:Putative transposase
MRVVSAQTSAGLGEGGPTSDLSTAQTPARWANRADPHPLDLLDPLVALIPPPRRHQHRYHGVLAPNVPLRAAVTAYTGLKYRKFKTIFPLLKAVVNWVRKAWSSCSKWTVSVRPRALIISLTCHR